MMGLVVMRRRWIAMVIALAGCSGDDAQSDQPDGPDCSMPDVSEPFVPGGVVQLNERCSASCPVIASVGDGFLVAWHEGEGTMNRTRGRRLDASAARDGPDDCGDRQALGVGRGPLVPGPIARHTDAGTLGLAQRR